jgi:pyrroline-5-carboxylate reductase
MQIAFIGGGNMASALIGGLLRQGWEPARIRVADIDAAARERIGGQFAVSTHETPHGAVHDADCVVLAVKPQHLRDVVLGLSAFVSDKLVLSIAAGIRARDISRWLGGHGRVVRAMPNTPALVLKGMTGLFAEKRLDAADRERVEAVMAVAGPTLWVETEAQMDAVTAVSGSGPAYVFYFLEALERAAVELGFDEQSARRLASQTFAGAIQLAAESSDDVATLRARVTSKGGTTERAISTLDALGVAPAIVRAVHAAAERSREMGDELGADAPVTKNGRAC